MLMMLMMVRQENMVNRWDGVRSFHLRFRFFILYMASADFLFLLLWVCECVWKCVSCLLLLGFGMDDLDFQH